VTYPDARVQTAIADRFVPLRLDLFKDRAVVRPLNVIWTPTLLVADRRGTVHYRNVNFLPPNDFLDMLDLGEASSRLRWAEYDHAIELLAAVTDRQPDGVFAAEAIYWRGITTYLKTHNNDEMYRVWQEILDRFPESVWAKRVP
jgi:hypothetical protein